MGWFFNRHRNDKREADSVIQQNGFFSTDIAMRATDDDTRREELKEKAKLVFQRSHKDMVVMDDAGNSIAMDEAYPDLQLAKIQNSIGDFLPFSLLTWYSSQSFIGYQLCAIIAQHWLVDKACQMPAKDAVRHGYDISTVDDDDVDPKALQLMKKLDKKFNIKAQCREFLHLGRLFGIRVAMFDVESTDPKYYEKPFNIDGVQPKSYKGISQVDPYWIAPELDQKSASNPASQHFYEPTWWRINGKRVHRSHLVIFRNGELPDILKPTYFYGGIPVPQKIAEVVFAAIRTSNEAPQLAMTKRLTVLKTDIAAAMKNLPAFEAKMTQWVEFMNNFGIKVVGEEESVEQFDTALADLDSVIMTQYQIVAAAADVPSTKLLGTSPKGFGASGDYEQDSYHEFLESLQEDSLTPFVERHHELIKRSEVCPTLNIKPFHTEVTWKTTDTLTAKEQAEVEKLKAERDNALVQAGAIDGTDSRQRIAKDPDSDYNGIPEIVPGGPGDRVAAQEAEAPLEQSAQASNKAKQGEA